jgi:hypothetical protein
MGLSPPAANAYSGSDCTRANPRHDTDLVHSYGPPVEFGDYLNGDTVVCWKSGRDLVEIRGRAFWRGGPDPGDDERFGGVEINLYNRSGQRVAQDGAFVSNHWPTTEDAFWIVIGRSDLNRVQFRPYTVTADGDEAQYLESKNRYYGD